MAVLDVQFQDSLKNVQKLTPFSCAVPSLFCKLNPSYNNPIKTSKLPSVLSDLPPAKTDGLERQMRIYLVVLNCISNTNKTIGIP